MIRTIIAVYSLTVFIPIIFSSADFQNNEDNTGLSVTSRRGEENDKRSSEMYSKYRLPGRPPIGAPRFHPGHEIIKANHGQRRQTIGSTSGYLKEDLSRHDGDISNANQRHPVKRFSKMYSKNQPPRTGREIIKAHQGQRRQTIGSTSGYLKEDLSRYEVSRPDGDIFNADLRHPVKASKKSLDYPPRQGREVPESDIFNADLRHQVKASKKSLDYPPRQGREVPESANTNIQSVQQQQQRNDKKSQVTRGEPITLQWCLNQDSLTRPEQLECLRLMLGAINTFLMPL